MLPVFAVGAALFALLLEGCGSKHTAPTSKDDTPNTKETPDRFTPYERDPMDKFLRGPGMRW